MDEPETDSAKKAESKAGLRIRELQAESRKLAARALETLADIMKSKGQDSVRLAAAREVLDRGYGRTKLGGAEGKAAGGKADEGGPYTVVVQRFSDPQDPTVEDFD
jgi:hypothetical protein